jgi:hypothetical protein
MMVLKYKNEIGYTIELEVDESVILDEAHINVVKLFKKMCEELNK